MTTTQTQSPLSTALSYRERGWSVFPVDKYKKPLIQWKQFQSRHASEQEIKTWWAKWPEANIGIVTGKVSNLSVLDIDTHHGGKTPKGIPITLTAKTQSGGWHYYFQYCDGLRNTAGVIADGVDVRSEGGYVIAPPSQGEKGTYEWIVEEPIAVFPQSVARNISKSTPLKDTIESTLSHRNDNITAAIGHLLVSTPESKWRSDAWPAIIAINKTFAPPLGEKELKTTFNSIAKKEKLRREKGESIISPVQISDTQKVNMTLRRNGNNVAYKDMTNVLNILEQHPKFKDRIRYDEFKRDIEFNNEPLAEQDILLTTFIVQKDILPMISKNAVYDALYHYAHEHTYDSAKDWLTSLVWDKVPRLTTWLVSSLGVEDDADGYIQGVGTQWFMGMVKRIAHPGCIFDNVLVIVGPQGIGKTSVFRILGGPWYKSYTGAVENKDFYIALRGAIIVDLDEGVALYKSESIKIKSIITETHDEYRAPYDKTTQKFPRRFVFSMSTNNTEPFHDVTGNRRYWVVDTENKVDFKWLEENREQLFAEAYHHLKNKTVLPQVPEPIAKERQDSHLSDDPWEEAVGTFLEDHPITTIEDVYLGVINKKENPDIERLGRREMMRIADILKKKKYKKSRRMIAGVQKMRWVKEGADENTMTPSDEFANF